MDALRKWIAQKDAEYDSAQASTFQAVEKCYALIELVGAQCHLAGDHLRKGAPMKALRRLQAAHACCAEYTGPMHPDLALALVKLRLNTSHTLSAGGKHEEALQQAQQACAEARGVIAALEATADDPAGGPAQRLAEAETLRCVSQQAIAGQLGWLQAPPMSVVSALAQGTGTSGVGLLGQHMLQEEARQLQVEDKPAPRRTASLPVLGERDPGAGVLIRSRSPRDSLPCNLDALATSLPLLAYDDCQTAVPDQQKKKRRRDRVGIADGSPGAKPAGPARSVTARLFNKPVGKAPRKNAFAAFTDDADKDRRDHKYLLTCPEYLTWRSHRMKEQAGVLLSEIGQKSDDTLFENRVFFSGAGMATLRKATPQIAAEDLVGSCRAMQRELLPLTQDLHEHARRIAKPSKFIGDTPRVEHHWQSGAHLAAMAAHSANVLGDVIPSAPAYDGLTGLALPGLERVHEQTELERNAIEG